MNRYGTEVIELNEPKSRQFFPEEFSNEIYYSNLSEFSYFSYKSNFSIKYVHSGKETYILDGERYSAVAGQYLLVNSGRTVETVPKGISEAMSIFVDMDVVKDVYSNFVNSEDQLLIHPDNDQQGIEFFECAFSNNDILGQVCGSIFSEIVSEGISEIEISKETYFRIAEKLVLSQKEVRTAISGIHNVKRATREELYKRALLAREFIEANSLHSFDFDLITQQCGMSKYHLIRTFKSAFGITPYRFHIICKVKSAKKFLRNSSFNMMTVAYLCGFHDVSSFSKTFRKVSGFSPSLYRLNIGFKN